MSTSNRRELNGRRVNNDDRWMKSVPDLNLCGSEHRFTRNAMNIGRGRLPRRPAISAKLFGFWCVDVLQPISRAVKLNRVAVDGGLGENRPRQCSSDKRKDGACPRGPQHSLVRPRSHLQRLCSRCWTDEMEGLARGVGKSGRGLTVVVWGNEVTAATVISPYNQPPQRTKVSLVPKELPRGLAS